MDKRELLKRWMLAYTEPSLFYVPWEKNDDEYFTVTLIPHVDYFDTLTESFITNTTLQDIYIKGTNYENQRKFGGIHDFIYESNSYIARDVNNNIVATSRWVDYMVAAQKIDESPIDNYTMEIYDVNMFEGSYTKRFVIKNIENLDDIDLLKEKITVSISYVLFVLKNGEIYRTIFKYSQVKKVGTYDYKKNKYHFSDKNFYSLHMVYHSPEGLRYYLNDEEIGKHPTLKLKKGTYTIEQIESSGGCEIMPPITITVDGDMVIDYRIKLNGYIVRAFLTNNSEPSFLRSIKEFNNDWSLIYTATGKFETFKSTTQVYDLSDYSLQVEQTIKTAASGGNIPIDNGKYLEDYGANSMWTVTYDDIHSYQLNSTICYPESFSEESILNWHPSYWAGIGTDPTKGGVQYHSNAYLYFYLYKFKPSTPFNVNELPDISEVEKIISSKSPEEWIHYGFERINNYYGVQCYGMDKCFRYQEIIKNYITPEGNSGNCFNDILYAHEGSLVNVVDSYNKSKSADIEKYEKCNQYAKRYDEYEKIEGKRIYKNYTTYLSDEIKYADGWDETKVNSMLEQIAENMYIEQLK